MDHTRESYITLASKTKAEYTDKKSRFIAFAIPISSREQAIEKVEKIKKKFPDATHHVYAWTLGGAVQHNKYTDDGEPSGTAGMPVLDILRKKEIEDSLIVVVRYFGGTLLGTGGLVKAYSTAAMAAVEKAGLIKMEKCVRYYCEIDYPDHERIMNITSKMDIPVTNIEYTDRITFTVLIPKEHEKTLLEGCADATGNRAKFKFSGTGYIKRKL